MKLLLSIFAVGFVLMACSGFKQFDGGDESDVATVDGDANTADDVVDSGPVDSGPVDFPASCVEVHRLTPAAVDGTFTLYAGHVPAQPWQVYCHDLAGLPAEYLTVANSGSTQNFAQYTAGGIGTSTRTVYQRIRIDPVTFRISTGDQRFATTTGDVVPSMPYAMAGDCNAAQTGLANIDLRGTPFVVVADGFVSGGFNAGGTATYSGSDQVVDLGGGGYCGWMAPRPVQSDLATALRGTILPLTYR